MPALRPTQSLVPPSCAVLVYDGACPFCTRAARWVEGQAGGDIEVCSFDEVPSDRWLTALSDRQLRGSAHFITTQGFEYHAGAAMTAALRHTRLALLASVLDRWPWAREAGYRLVARSRSVLSRFVR